MSKVWLEAWWLLISISLPLPSCPFGSALTTDQCTVHLSLCTVCVHFDYNGLMLCVLSIVKQIVGFKYSQACCVF